MGERKDVSGLLGQYLLKGWTMMQDGCPVCVGVPLMKSKSNELFCVQCDQFILPSTDMVVEEEVAKDQLVAPAAEPELFHSVSKTNSLDPFESTPSTETQFNSMKANQERGYSQMSESLENKLEYLRKLLESANHVSDIKQVCEAIETCSNALQSIKKL
jgi:uncharacterized Zn finger protein (UPF0148 family)